MCNTCETGGNLDIELYKQIALECKKWFEENNVTPPIDSKRWSLSKVSLKEIPPGMTYHTLRRKGVNHIRVLYVANL